MDERDYKAMNKTKAVKNVELIEEISVEFYLWMQKNGIGRN